MKKTIFDLIIASFSLFENPIYNYISMTIIGLIAFKLAFGIVGKSELRGEAGSIVHWIIRFLAFVFIWFVCSILIKLITFIMNNWLVVIISCLLLLLIYVLKIYSKNNPTSILNKKIF